jgi:hypothetical protein
VLTGRWTRDRQGLTLAWARSRRGTDLFHLQGRHRCGLKHVARWSADKQGQLRLISWALPEEITVMWRMGGTAAVSRNLKLSSVCPTVGLLQEPREPGLSLRHRSQTLSAPGTENIAHPQPVTTSLLQNACGHVALATRKQAHCYASVFFKHLQWLWSCILCAPSSCRLPALEPLGSRGPLACLALRRGWRSNGVPRARIESGLEYSPCCP